MHRRRHDRPNQNANGISCIYCPLTLHFKLLVSVWSFLMAFAKIYIVVHQANSFFFWPFALNCKTNRNLFEWKSFILFNMLLDASLASVEVSLGASCSSSYIRELAGRRLFSINCWKLNEAFNKWNKCYIYIYCSCELQVVGNGFSEFNFVWVGI